MHDCTCIVYRIAGNFRQGGGVKIRGWAIFSQLVAAGKGRQSCFIRGQSFNHENCENVTQIKNALLNAHTTAYMSFSIFTLH